MFLIGQDFESFKGKSGAILGGQSTFGNDLYVSASYSAISECVLDFYLDYNMKLIIKDSVLTVNVQIIFSIVK